MTIPGNQKGTKRGTLILVVGPSGAGKDTLLNGVVEHFAGESSVLLARRIITRPADSSEAHEPVSEPEFLRREQAGEFMQTWRAHNLRYALPASLLDALSGGTMVLANVSRTVITTLAESWSDVIVVEVTAPIQDMEQRLSRRGRESDSDVQARLQRQVPRPETSLPWHRIHNDGSREQGIKRFVDIVQSLLAPTS